MLKESGYKTATRILWTLIIVFLSIVAISGLHLFYARGLGSHSITLDRIYITEKEQSKKVDLSNITLYRGFDQLYELEISTTLNEDIYYRIDFSNHTIKDSDKQLYISISNDSSAYLMNNTLFEIFTNRLSVKDTRLPDSKKDTLKFKFSLSQSASEDFTADFSMTIYAEGKPFNV